MALWKSEVTDSTTGVEHTANSVELAALKPSWLLGGTDGVNSSNELATVTTSAGVGWIMTHDKGGGRSWDELLAACDINGTPTAGDIIDRIVASNSSTDIILVANDTNGDPLTYLKTAGAGTLVDNVYTFSAGAVDALAETTTIRVSDDRGAFIDVDFDITVNAPPTLSAANGSYTLAAATLNVTLDGSGGTVGSSITYTAGTPVVNQTEPVESLVAPTIGTVTFVDQTMTVPISTDGTLASADTIVISVTATDAEDLAVSADVTIIVA